MPVGLLFTKKILSETVFCAKSLIFGSKHCSYSVIRQEFPFTKEQQNSKSALQYRDIFLGLFLEAKNPQFIAGLHRTGLF